MATHTPNYDLKKSAPDDFYNIEDQNENMDKIDSALKGVSDDLTSHIANDAVNAHNISNITGLQSALESKEPTLNTNQKRPIYIQSSPPENPQEGDIWIEV